MFEHFEKHEPIKSEKKNTSKIIPENLECDSILNLQFQLLSYIRRVYVLTSLLTCFVVSINFHHNSKRSKSFGKISNIDELVTVLFWPYN